MRIKLRCLPGYEAFLPKPQLAKAALPEWLKAMRSLAASPVLDGGEVRTVKTCPPFIDALGAGILFPLAADVQLVEGSLSWDWKLPVQAAARMTRSPIGLHLPEQLAGVPLAQDADSFVVKFTNFWTLELPEGWSMLFCHPFNREDLPFRTLTGLVDCDRWRNGFVHFPALWTDPLFSGTLPAGTPVAQALPVRREALKLEFAEMDPAELALHLEVQDGLQEDPGLYRRHYRAAGREA